MNSGLLFWQKYSLSHPPLHSFDSTIFIDNVASKENWQTQVKYKFVF